METTRCTSFIEKAKQLPENECTGSGAIYGVSLHILELYRKGFARRGKRKTSIRELYLSELKYDSFASSRDNLIIALHYISQYLKKFDYGMPLQLTSFPFLQEMIAGKLQLAYGHLESSSKLAGRSEIKSILEWIHGLKNLIQEGEVALKPLGEPLSPPNTILEGLEKNKLNLTHITPIIKQYFRTGLVPSTIQNLARSPALSRDDQVFF